MTRQFTNLFTVARMLIAMIGTGFGPATADANVYSHIDRLAVRIDNRAEQIVRETRHYVRTPEYAYLVADAQAMCRLASHIHEVSHFEGNLFHLQSDVAELDAQFHHLDSLITSIEHNAAYGSGQLSGCTKRMRRLLNLIETDIHHMQSDLNSLLRPVPVVVSRPAFVPQPVYVRPVPVNVAPRPCRQPAVHRGSGFGSPGYGAPGFGGAGLRGFDQGGINFSMGGGRSQMTFRF